MTADVELLPLELQGAGTKFNFTRQETRAIARDYARANVAHATAAKDAEIEALRAEVAAWRELSDHVRAGACNAIWPDRYTDARTRDVAAALKRAGRLAEALREIERLMPDQAGPAWIAKTIASAALRDHDHGESNAP